MNGKFKYILCLLLTAYPLSVEHLKAQSGAGPLEDRLSAEIDSLIAVMGSALARRDSLRTRSEGLAAQVGRFKQSQERDYSTLVQYRLEAALRQSQAAADSLDSLNRIIESGERTLAGRRLEALARSTAALDSLSRALEAAGDPGLRAAILQRIGQYSAWRSNLTRPGERPSRPPRSPGADLSLERLTREFRISSQDSPEQILEKADFLSDMAGKWTRSLEVLEKNIARLNEEKALRTRLGEFAQELSLFDETGPASRAGVRSGKSAGEEARLETDLQAPDSRLMVTGQFLETLPALDLELSNPETALYLLQNVEHLSLDDLETALGGLKGQLDSLRVNLELLRRMEQDFRSRAGRSGKRQEETPRQ